MARSNQPPPPQAANLTIEQMRRGIERLRKRIEELESFEPREVPSRFHSSVDALDTAIADTLDRVFGADTIERRRFNVAPIDSGPIQMGGTWGRGYEPDFRGYLQEGKDAALTSLRTAIRVLEEEIEEQSTYSSPPPGSPVPSGKLELSRKVFIVHGRDDGPREAVARFLERLGFIPIILNEQANQGRTVIEKVEAYSDVDFAVVLLTPDDEGNLVGEAPRYRARQNVILELGYFIGKLTRKHVCTLVAGDIEIPSDWRGVVDEKFDAAGAWRQVLARELEAAGHRIDWNTVMRPQAG